MPSTFASRPGRGLFAAAAALTFAATAAQAQETPSVEDLRSLSIEQLAEIEITSVSRRAEPLSQAEAAVYVLTGDDVRASGKQSLPEVLRLAPNLQIARIDALDYSITARGFAGFESANKLLVLIDGRSVYTPLYSGVDWDQHHVVLGDVERIEVISGPGGALYGANAVNGVINVLTRSAADTQGGLLEVAAGTLDSQVTGRYGGRFGDSGAWRVYANAFSRGPMREPDGDEANDDYDGWQTGFRTDVDAGANRLTVQGDLFDHTLDSSIGLPGGYARGGNLLARWTHRFGEASALELQGYYDRSERRARGIYGRLDTVDLEARQTLTLGRHQLVAGGGYRLTEDDFANLLAATLTLTPPSKQVSIGNLFVQDQVALGETMTLTAGLKLEHNSYTGLEVLPSLRMAWRPTEQALFWAAVSRAVRNPSRIERDLTFPGIIVAGRFEPESLVAYEGGFRGRITPNTSLSVNVFHNVYDDLRSNELSPGNVFPVFVGNSVRGETFGVEAWADVVITDWWRFSAGFTALEKDFELKPGNRDVSRFESVGVDPARVFKLRSQMRLSDRLDLDLRLRGYGDVPIGEASGYVGAPAYVEADVRLAWRVKDGVELALTGLNLLHEQHREASEARALEVPRSVHAELRWSY